jgi:hypothetical protein
MRKRFFLPIFLPLIFLFSISHAHAQVNARLRVIQASNAGSVVDPSLRDVYGKLGSLFSFTSYRLLREQDIVLTLNQPVKVQAHPEVFIEATLVGLQAGIAEIRVRINRNRADILNTQVRLSPDRTVLVGGSRHGEGVVIYALSARF